MNPNRLAIGLSFLLLGTIAGCGVSKGDVTGKVSYQGKPVLSGNISLIASDSIQYVGSIDADGNYAIKGVPVGLAKISVTSPRIESASPVALLMRGLPTIAPNVAPAPIPSPAAVSGWFPIPEKSETTGTVKSPKCTIDIDLK